MKWMSTIALVFPLSLSLMAQVPENSPQNGRRPQGRPDLAKMDTDGDGKISASEWKGPADVFKRLDSDNDGYATREEMNQLRRQNGKRGAAADTNNDGKITREEWKGMPEVFDRLDANNDGYIGPLEATMD